MKIAFIGKGGSGKSTITSIIGYLLSKKNKVVIFDADLNIHIEKFFNLKIDKEKYISNNQNVIEIKKYLAGNNHKADYRKMVKTTPPGNGSNFFTIDDNNFIIKNYSLKINKNLYLINIGTYEGEKAGLSCYHTNLGVFENILSHNKIKNNDYLLADMVAGIDSLANTLFIQFDVYFFIIEPTIESINVYLNYIEELKKTSYKINIYPIINKVENIDDVNFVKNYLKNNNLIIFEKNNLIKKYSQKLITINDLFSDKKIKKFFDDIKNILKKIKVDPNQKLKDLINLHKSYCQLDYVLRANGDLSNQIDYEFKF